MSRNYTNKYNHTYRQAITAPPPHNLQSIRVLSKWQLDDLYLSK